MRETSCCITRMAQALAILALAISAGAGCTFWALDGGGPVSKESAFKVYGRPPTVIPENQRQVFERIDKGAKWQRRMAFQFRYAGRSMTTKLAKKTDWWFMIGPGSVGEWTVARVDSGQGVEPVYRMTDTFIPGLPLIWVWGHGHTRFYAPETGREISDDRVYALGLAGVLAAYRRSVHPAGSRMPFGTFPRDYAIAAAAAKSEDMRYEVKWGWHLALGLVGFGRVNHYYYGQFAWVPIPLWRTRE